MKKMPCQYAIVRFMPFIETEEFANVGVLLMAPYARYFDFKLLTRRHGRITKFFDELNAQIFRTSMYDLKEELTRVNDMLQTLGFDRRLKVYDVEAANRLFSEILRSRETIVRFSEPRVVLTHDPKIAMKELFAHYVERNFVTKKYRETVLEKNIRSMLFSAHAGEQFARARVGDEEYQVTFPFVELQDETPVKIIKPLHLGQEYSSKIIEIGGKWQFRIKELRKRRTLPRNVLFAVEGPTENDRRHNAYKEALEMLTDTDVSILSIGSKKQILEFALGG